MWYFDAKSVISYYLNFVIELRIFKSSSEIELRLFNSILKDTNSVIIRCQNILRNVSIETLMALGMITVFVNVMTKGSIMEVMNQKTGKNDYSIVFYTILKSQSNLAKYSFQARSLILYTLYAK